MCSLLAGFTTPMESVGTGHTLLKITSYVQPDPVAQTWWSLAEQVDPDIAWSLVECHGVVVRRQFPRAQEVMGRESRVASL
uniref:SFRICE_020167 n=1 Tax=Spodoptera frugiperda TaxID=7108 RepID=A0A2H1VDL2_SPOFR